MLNQYFEIAKKWKNKMDIRLSSGKFKVVKQQKDIKCPTRMN